MGVVAAEHQERTLWNTSAVLCQVLRDDNGAVGCALVRGMTVAQSLANSDAPTSDPISDSLGSR
jgi:hypothetical protein